MTFSLSLSDTHTHTLSVTVSVSMTFSLSLSDTHTHTHHTHTHFRRVSCTICLLTCQANLKSISSRLLSISLPAIISPTKGPNLVSLPIGCLENTPAKHSHHHHWLLTLQLYNTHVCKTQSLSMYHHWLLSYTIHLQTQSLLLLVLILSHWYQWLLTLTVTKHLQTHHYDHTGISDCLHLQLHYSLTQYSSKTATVITLASVSDFLQ